MPYCSKCGVKLDNNIEKCPLCNLSIQKFDQSNSINRKKYPEQKYRESLSNRQIRFFTWQILSIVFAIGFLIVMTINLLQNSSLSWAGYPMTAIGAAWLLMTFVVFFLKTPILIITGNFITLSGLFVLLDIIDGNLNWFLTLGLPILGMVATIALIVYFSILLFKNKYSLILSIFLNMIVVFCIGINLLISGFQGNTRISWSLFVTIAIVPISLLLLWYNFHLRKIIDFKKIFHY